MTEFCSPWPSGVSYPVSITTSTSQPDADDRPKHIKSKPKPKQSLALSEPLPDDRIDDPGYFPAVEVKHSYLYSGCSIRDTRARKASLRVCYDLQFRLLPACCTSNIGWLANNIISDEINLVRIYVYMIIDNFNSNRM